ncbi:MAG TPA: hypothetical protein VFG67_10350 [Oleiagrimonas sp.]|nr:hypothetical protein [Oleiagrimonas sp.]
MLKSMLWLLSAMAATQLLAPGVRAADVAPAETAQANCPWVTSTAPIAERVEQLLGRMTLEQKLHELHGVTRTHDWQVPQGDYRIMLGDSSAHLPEQAVIRVH